MHRLAAVSLFGFLTMFQGVSRAHADLDLQFANITDLDTETFTFSIDVQMTGAESDPLIVLYGLSVQTGGLAVTSIHNTSPLAYHEWFEYEEAEDLYLIAGWDGGTAAIDPGPDPIGLFRLDLMVTEPAGPWTIDLANFTFRTAEGDILETGQESYTLTIPAPAPLALMGCGLGAVRRRRIG